MEALITQFHPQSLYLCSICTKQFAHYFVLKKKKLYDT